jgi:hypothetical protein
MSTFNNLISFGAIVGDEDVDEIVLKYTNEISKHISQKMSGKSYGVDLSFLLVFLYVEGSHSWFKMPEKEKIGRYSEKEKAIRYNVPVTKSNFFDLDEVRRKNFIVEVVRNSLLAAEKQLKKKSLEIDFELLKADFNAAADSYQSIT